VTADLIVIGGGVMGLFTAYNAAAGGARVVVLERGRIGDPMTASYGRTRSFRNDYLDDTYARFAHEAFRLWGDFERDTGAPVLVRCGCMNIGKRSVTPDLDNTYAQLSFEVLERLRMKTESLDGEELRKRLQDRVKDHERRAAWYKAEAKREADLEDEYDFVLPEHMCEHEEEVTAGAPRGWHRPPPTWCGPRPRRCCRRASR